MLRQQWRSLCNIDCALVVAGMVMLWPILRAPFQLTAMSTDIAFGFDPHFFYDLALVFVGVVFVIGTAAFERFLASDQAKAHCSVFAGLLSFAGVAVLFAFSNKGGLTDYLVLAGAVVLALGLAILLALWSLRLIRMGFGTLCCCVTLSYAASFLLGVFDYSSEALRILCYVLPLGSAFLLFLSFWRVCRYAECFNDAGSAPPPRTGRR